MSVKWTEEQQKVIDLRNRNILVSAAAGSGKTAVLVERIIRMLTDREHPVDVDRLLIVTFTEAAAAEMKERIREAIEKALESDPGNVNLQRQATLIHSAPITTIHSFCLSVIRDHFHVIDIDPGFRIAEEGELKLLKQDVLEELLEACYADGSKEFLEMAEKFGGGRNDKKLEEQILQLYEYSRSYPQPGRWLRQCAEQYRNDGNEPEFISQAMNRIRQYLKDIQEVLLDGIRICEEPDGPYMQADILEADLKMLNRAAQSETFSDMYGQFSSLKWKRLSTKKDESVSPEKRERVKELRGEMKKLVGDLTEAYFYEAPEEIRKDLEDSYETMRTFTELVNRFADAFAEKKQSKNLIDFGDMEQFALRILTEEVEGELKPSVTAREYQEQFAEVMIDEYQDSNLIQEAILTSVSTVSRGDYNVFMVGDVKQSIYRFRLSRPELFMEKYDTYSLDDSACQRIDLHKNFRSRTEVLDGANYIFRRIMRKELGGICYDDQAALYPGAVFEPMRRDDGTSEFAAELLLVDPTGDMEAKELEARIVAHRIRELVQSSVVTDKKTGKLRRAQYRDIVILTRSIKGWADVYASILAEEGIPAYAGSREGYFETYEVSVLLDYLTILDNMRQDLPLAAVLTSPFVGLNAQQLAEIKTEAKTRARETEDDEKTSESGNFFYEAVRNAANENTGEIGEKLRRFYRQIERFREMIPYTPIHELLWRILEETGYGLYISAMPGGEQRAANVEMLVEKAAVFEGTSYKGLFHFVRYIEQLRKYDVDYGEANIADEQADTVRIMSIHKSKGLEFPIVFAAGMGKRFNMTDITGSLIIHPEWGAGIDAVDLERRTKIPTLLKKVIQQEVKLETLGEELRVLYVALTRAKEKLIMIGATDEKTAERVRGMQEADGDGGIRKLENEQEIRPLSFYQLAKARSYMDWVTAAVLGEETPIKVRVLSQWDVELENHVEKKGDEIARDVLEHWNTETVYDEALRKHLEEQGSFSYPYREEQKMQLKFTVSELKKHAYLEEESGELLHEEPDVVPLIPKFMQETEELKGASRGSAYHKVLELLDFSEEYKEETLHEQVGEQIRRFREEGRLSKEMADCIRIPDILRFLNSGAGKRMQAAARAGRLWREQPFVLGVPATEIYPEIQSEEMILVQGIIDVCFEENGELVVLDYKTDRVQKAEELREKYHAQLDYYAEALEQLLKKPVKEKLIYSFTLQEEIRC